MFYLYMPTKENHNDNYIYLLDGEKICRYALFDMNKEMHVYFYVVS